MKSVYVRINQTFLDSAILLRLVYAVWFSQRYKPPFLMSRLGQLDPLERAVALAVLDVMRTVTGSI